METTKPILAEIESFLAATGKAETTLGHEAVKDSRVVARLREGGITFRTAEKILAYVRSYPVRGAQ